MVPYTPGQMFALVADVNAYDAFLPWCSSSRVLREEAELVEAEVAIAYGRLHKTFATRNRLQQDKMIEMRLLEGPFRHLEGYWRFDRLGEQGCKVSLDLEFEFSSKLVALAMGPVFTQIANSLVDAFCQRAEQIYGRQ